MFIFNKQNTAKFTFVLLLYCLAFFVYAPCAELKSITLALDNKTNFGNDGYKLTIRNDTALITAGSSLGAFYGVQTLRQLLPAEIESPSLISGVLWNLPGVAIIDSARFVWRGVMIDCGRHFFTKDVIKRQLDLMSCYKLNRFHWHLSDDQGWRIQIKKYPALADSESYSQEDIRDVVEYASKRGIMVIPEIEMPGHCVAALRKFPMLSCTGGPIPDPASGGVHEDVFCAGNDSVFVFLENVLDEVVSLFPCPLVHIGGDEVTGVRWDTCPKCRARMDAESLSSTRELQKWFVQKIASFLRTKNRDIAGWNEILYEGAPEGAFIQAWQNAEVGITAAGNNHKTIMSPITDMYSWNNNHAYLPLSRMYSFEPVPKALDLEKVTFILGAEHCIWTEGIETESYLDFHAWGRNCALAELCWTAAGQKNWSEFTTAISRHYSRLEYRGVDFYRDSSIKLDTSASRFLIIPKPVSLVPGNEEFLITSQTVINVSDSTRFAGEYLAKILKQSAGFELKTDVLQENRGGHPLKDEFFSQHILIRRTSHYLVVSGLKNSMISNVQLINPSGRIITAGKQVSKSQQRLSIASLPSGIYLLACCVGEQMVIEYISILH